MHLEEVREYSGCTWEIALSEDGLLPYTTCEPERVWARDDQHCDYAFDYRSPERRGGSPGDCGYDGRCDRQ